MSTQKGRFVSVATILLMAAGGAFSDMIVFHDGFESYATGSQLNWTPPGFPASPWGVVGGTLDLIRSGDHQLTASTGQGLLAGGSFFLDMDGSTNNAGDLVSIALDQIGGVNSPPGPFTPLIDGHRYAIEFIMAGSQRTVLPDPNIANIGIVLAGGGGENVLLSYTLSSNTPWSIYATPTFTFHTGDRVFFRNLNADGNPGDNVGFLLDNVRIRVVPEPASLSVLGMGIVGLVASRMRRKRA